MTPYASLHVGHALRAVVFDVIRRYLEFRGFEVRHVENFTDIDDKMIQGAAAAGISAAELAEKNISEYLDEMDALNVVRAHEYPRATQEIDGIVQMIQGLEEKGFAYPANGSVYFRVRRSEHYGKLSHRTLDSLRSGARVEIDESKEDPLDFALWKARKEGEPSWDSPWGPGRPGWHIECSAMNLEHLGETLDIHGGGQDLIFPHHENEIAQSEAYTGERPFARIWVHNALLRMGEDEDKMSKSLGNVVSIKEALGRFSPDALRLFFLSSHYRSPLSYTDEAISAQDRALERLRNAVEAPPAPSAWGRLDPDEYREKFIAGMDDDLNTPRALAALFDLARDINRGRDSGQAVTEAQETLRTLAGTLGLTLAAPASGSSDIGLLMELLIETRATLREAKQFEAADRIRERLGELGYALEDKPQGTVWKQSQGS